MVANLDTCMYSYCMNRALILEDVYNQATFQSQESKKTILMCDLVEKFGVTVN